jgi:hypothetical protein
MKSTVLVAASVAALSTLSGCATRPSGIAPLSVDASEYYHLSCSDAKAELETTRQKEAALSRQQNNAATGDAVGVFLLLVPVGSVFGADVEGELALAKGQVRALETTVKKQCREEAEAAEAAKAPAPAAVQTAPTAE